MMVKDTVCEIDIGPDDGLYKVHRNYGDKQRVVYVLLQYLDFIPEDSRTWGPGVIKELSKLHDWNGEWKTLTVSKNASGIQTRADVFEPHRLPREQLQDSIDLFNIADLKVLKGVKSRVTCVEVDGKPCFLKIARFGFEMAAIAREIRAYETLMDSKLVPRLLGYAYEETPDRVIGFVFEAICGSHPSINSLDICREALQQLHSLNVTHGDINRYNILVTEDGAKFIDLEVSDLDSNDGKKMDKEMLDLEEQLLGESNDGCPW